MFWALFNFLVFSINLYTMYDVFAMLGLPSDGIAIHHGFEFKHSETVVIDKTELALTYTRFLAKYRKTGDAIITFEEETYIRLYVETYMLTKQRPSKKEIVTERFDNMDYSPVSPPSMAHRNIIYFFGVSHCL